MNVKIVTSLESHVSSLRGALVSTSLCVHACMCKSEKGGGERGACIDMYTTDACGDLCVYYYSQHAVKETTLTQRRAGVATLLMHGNT